MTLSSVCDTPFVSALSKTDLCGHRGAMFCSGSLLSAFSSTVGFQGTLGLGPPQGHLPLVESKLEGVAGAQVLLLTLRL